VLRISLRYTANSLQVNPAITGNTSGVPAAISPDGPTITDTAPHVTAAEVRSQDVTTAFIGSLAVEKSDPTASTFSSPAYVTAMSTEFLMTLKKTLCRPIQVASGTWNTSDAVGMNEFSGSLPEILLALPIIQRKLDGFQGIRGSITLRLQATANPFQQGLLKLNFYPMQAQDSSYPGRATYPESWSFWPGVELNLGKETACELRVPYTLPVAFCDLVTTSINSRPQMGTAFVKVYSQLKTGPGTTSVGWNLYAHWNEDDLELFNPTPNSYQSGSKHVVKSTRLPSDAEKKGMSISDSLSVGAHIAEASTAIPVLADVAGPTAWALRVASRVASALGFSRPPVDSKPQFVTISPMPYNSNVEGPDVSMPLSFTIQPSLKFEPKLSSKNEDEMAIDSFCSKFGFQSIVNVTSSEMPGTVLLNLAMSVSELTTNELIYPKPFQVLGKIFNFWRGNLRVRIKFIKTKMHTARLMFLFAPGVVTNLNLTQAEYCHREIIDIADVEELVYELPYTSTYPYLNTNGFVANFGAYGSFQILVVNSLQAPSSVNSSIDFIVETAMGEGSEWFCPQPQVNLLPQVPVGASPQQRPRSNSLRPPNRPQSGQVGGLVRVTTLSDAKTTNHQTETAQLCVGEKLLSLRQIIKYPASLYSTPFVFSPETDDNGYFPPQFFCPFALGGVASDGSQQQPTGDLLSLIAPYFRFSRGSMRVRGTFGASSPGVQSTNDATIVFTARNSANPGMFGPDASANRVMWGGNYQHSSEGNWKVLVPPWQTAPMVDHHYVTPITPIDVTLMGRQTALQFSGFGYSPDSVLSIALTRQPADDYELLQFIGPPAFQTYTVVPPPAPQLSAAQSSKSGSGVKQTA
jgi:hypothetical protein